MEESQSSKCIKTTTPSEESYKMRMRLVVEEQTKEDFWKVSSHKLRNSGSMFYTVQAVAIFEGLS